MVTHVVTLRRGTKQAWRVLALLLVCLLFGLTPLAYADPPDPLWLPGFWDDDDFDNVVGAVCAAAALIAEFARSTTAPGASPLDVLPHAPGLSPVIVSALSIRAPPFA